MHALYIQYTYTIYTCNIYATKLLLYKHTSN